MNRWKLPFKFLLFSWLWLTNVPSAFAGQPSQSPVLAAMQAELSRSMEGFRQTKDPAYFIAYRVTHMEQINISASYGALDRDQRSHHRWLDVQVRVGDYKLDNTHNIRTQGGFYGFNMNRPKPLPIEDDVEAIRSVLWLQTDTQYRKAVKKLSEVKRDRTLKVKEEDTSDDFSKEKVHQDIQPLAKLKLATAKWRKALKKYSALFLVYPELMESKVSLRASAENKFFASTEGTRLQHGRVFIRLGLSAKTKAEDGMELERYRAFDVRTIDDLPKPTEIRQAIAQLAKGLQALRKAPTMEPYTGPAILTGKAAGVFFHEIFGHRIEGHRQKDEQDGQTFTKKIGHRILPPFISVIDDPTKSSFEGADLRGHYRYDDEGVAAQKVVVVNQGTLERFLMSRKPLGKSIRSNGHGRAQHGHQAVARQGNLIIKSSQPVSEKRLRQMLISEAKKQGKPYGLLFTEIAGGFTFTGRGIPQAFDVRPLMVHRIYVDGRQDELVRGVELIGTPLTSFSKILATSENYEIFNGTCGAESGGVPVSSIAPSILTAQIEVQKKEKSADRPPLLPPPGKEVSR